MSADGGGVRTYGALWCGYREAPSAWGPQRNGWAEASPVRLFDIPMLRVTFPEIPAATFRRWAAKGWITRQGTDDKGRALYDMAEVESVVQARRSAPS